MARFSTHIIFTSVLCQLTVTAASGTPKEVAGALDGSVTFTLNTTEVKVDSVVWTFKTLFLAIINKNGTIKSQSYEERIVFLDRHSMKLSQLKKNDSGDYRAEIHIASNSLSSPFMQEYVLHVHEHLSRPKVNTDSQSSKDGTCILNLTCSVERGGENVTYSWKAVGQTVDEFHDSANLSISWRLGEKDKTIICTARNPVSSSSSTPLLTQKLCKDAAKDLNSPRVLKYILCVTLVLVLFCILLVTILFRWIPKGKGFEEDKKRVDGHQEMSNSCPHLENTDYDTIPYTEKKRPEEDAPNTLYSTVQIPKVVKSPSSPPAMPHPPRSLSFENVI